MSKQPPPAPTASAVGPCLTRVQIVGRPGTGSLPSTITPPDHPRDDSTERAQRKFSLRNRKNNSEISLLYLPSLSGALIYTNFTSASIINTIL